MPATPKKKADILEKIAVGSPRTKALLTERGLLKTPEEQKETTTLRALAADISESLSHVKKSGSSEKRAAYTAFKSLAFGKNVKKARAKRSLSKLVNLPEKTISRAISRREKVLKGDIPSWQYMNRKVRSDALSAEDSKLIYDYWTHQASRPTGDKKDVVKQRISRRQYIHHAKHVLEKTQTEAYMEFRELYPNIKVSQRKFESLKPFFVKQARERDRKSCLCRKHVETQIVFSACMKFRKALLKKNPELESSVSVPKTVTEAATLTLCPKPEGSMFHNIKCLERQCSECGVHKLQLLPEENSDDGLVHWSRYEYVPTGKFLSNGQEKKKIAFVPKETPPSQLFAYFKELLKGYMSHCFMARWQREQLNSLLDNLPMNHVVCIYDYSVGYTCRQQNEIQSEFFDPTKVFLHVTILHRHAVGAVDGVSSTDGDPQLIKEHVFVISDDPVQDYDSVHKAQELIHAYLKNDVGYPTQQVHEFTDGCAAQYKSRHCVGDLSCSLSDFGFTMQRNYFETSHAKGEQDAAGSHIKQKVSQAVLRQTATITNAKSMYEFLSQNFSLPAVSAKSVELKRRIFFYVPASGEAAVKRNRAGRHFKEAKGIRKWHCVKSSPVQGKLQTRFRSCYCTNCILGDEESCINKEWRDDWKEVVLDREPDGATTRQDAEQSALNHDSASHIADLGTKGSTVAIAADDTMYDFYLLRVSSDGVEELDETIIDDYGSQYYAGHQVLRGHFYLRENIHDMTFSLDTTRMAIVYAATVRHICGDLKQKGKKKKPIYKLSLEQNEDIIASL